MFTPNRTANASPLQQQATHSGFFSPVYSPSLSSLPEALQEEDSPAQVLISSARITTRCKLEEVRSLNNVNSSGDLQNSSVDQHIKSLRNSTDDFLPVTRSHRASLDATQPQHSQIKRKYLVEKAIQNIARAYSKSPHRGIPSLKFTPTMSNKILLESSSRSPLNNAVLHGKQITKQINSAAGLVDQSSPMPGSVRDYLASYKQ